MLPEGRYESDCDCPGSRELGHDELLFGRERFNLTYVSLEFKVFFFVPGRKRQKRSDSNEE